MAETTFDDSTANEGRTGEMERGVNILTNSQPVIVDGAEEAIEKFNNGEISADILYEMILDAPVVYVDRSKTSEFKESKDTSSAE
jgi:hypothetical protein